MVVTIHPEALAEMSEAVDFYEQRTPGLGRDLFDEIETLLERTADHPGVGTAYDPPYRRLLCQRFPFAIIYREVEGSLNVLAVMHQRRRPGYWKGRTGSVREGAQEPSYAARSAATYANARDFLAALPAAFPTPEVGVEGEGSVSFDWFPGPKRLFSVR